MPESKDNCIFVIFGGTGDLTKRKLIPALYNLFIEDRLSKNLMIVSIGRRDYTNEYYIELMERAVRQFSEDTFSAEKWEVFKERICYNQFDFSSDFDGYRLLDRFLRSLDEKHDTKGNRIFYLAVPPDAFETIIENLKKFRMIENTASWERVMVEKPFGSNLETAQNLNENISKNLPEDKIFRIDHYLGKEMIQNIMAIRFGNSIFEPLWNHHYIDNIQIISMETIGVENRGAYYESTGILKDMLQNHILQMLALISMEPPINMEPESIRDEKVKAIRSLRLFNHQSARENIVLGQYGKGKEMKAYREEENVSSDSKVPTFIALKACIDNFRWGGVPFYIKVGKSLNDKCTKIVVQFKKLPGINNYREFDHTKPNILVIRIQPSEGIFFQINAKKPGNEFLINNVELDYCQKSKYSSNSTKAYERLILEAIRNNSSLFTRWDELQYSWKYIESIEESTSDFELSYPNYSAGSQGPDQASLLISRDGNKWWT
ncbi:MAG: glucose-6-phosphate dehydrogenase [Clostridia bacterium]|nr:glucose-6-phosphate dehydrogenase [Clostridia bacterium]